MPSNPLRNFRAPTRALFVTATLFTAATLLAAAGACGGSSTVGTGGGGQAGGGGDGGSAECALDPPSADTFTFTINNVGTRDLRLFYGCGKELPIELATPHGSLGIGPGSADFCEVSCDSVYAGQPNWGCSDCGPGYGDPLNPNDTVVIEWDRRVYKEHTSPATCSTNPDAADNPCALGIATDPATVLSGKLILCTSEAGGGDGYCSSDDIEELPITVDLTTNELVIEVM